MKICIKQAGFNNFPSQFNDANNSYMPANVVEESTPKKSVLGFFKLSYDIPIQFDARLKWSSVYTSNGEPIDINCPSVKKVFNSGKCKCGWVCVFNII